LIKKNLSEIIFPINKELDDFSIAFKKSMKTKVGLLDLVTRYILMQKGKKIRPALVILTSKSCGEVNDRTYRGATLVELLHTATLVHDDVVDSAETRRGFPSINAVWKNKVAVLMGDYLLAKGLMLSVDGNDYDFLKVITNSVKRMSEGELLQISKTHKLNNDEATYFRIISDKTASLLSTCCEIGARSVSSNPDKINDMKDYGEYIGIAFQIKDDILDYVGKSLITGKPLGGDIKEKKLTLPLIYSLNNSNNSEKREIIKLIKSGKNKKNITEVIEFVKRKGGIEYSEKIAFEYSQKAISKLENFTESDSKTALIELANYVIERKK